MSLIFPPFRPIYPYYNPKYFSSYKKPEKKFDNSQSNNEKILEEKKQNNRVSTKKDTPINSLLSIFSNFHWSFKLQSKCICRQRRTSI